MIICTGAPGGLPKKHDITFLLNQVKNYLLSSIPQEIKGAGNDLNQYATATRYPTEEEIGQAEADQAIEEATAILQWVEREAEVMWNCAVGYIRELENEKVKAKDWDRHSVRYTDRMVKHYNDGQS